MDQENEKQRPFMATPEAMPLFSDWSRISLKAEACVVEYRTQTKRAALFHRIGNILTIPMWLLLAATWVAAILYPGSWLLSASITGNLGSAFALMICLVVSSLERWGAASSRSFYWWLRREEDQIAAKLGITAPSERETDKEMM